MYPSLTELHNHNFLTSLISFLYHPAMKVNFVALKKKIIGLYSLDTYRDNVIT